jgi:hypothetical protein
MESSTLRDRLLQSSDELLQSQPERLAEHPQFHHVDPPLPAFALGYKRLSFVRAAWRVVPASDRPSLAQL